MAASSSWTAPVAANEWPAEGRETAFLRLCGPLFRRAVLVVPRDASGGWSVLREAKK